MSFINSFEKYSIENYGYVRLPEIKISQEQLNAVNAKDGVSNIEFLRLLLRKGFIEKNIPKTKWKQYGERINYEINIIDELGFVDYILLVWMVINKAKELNVFLDFGRGSVGGSAVCWLLGISGPDPIEKGLIFERFISKARAGKKIIDGHLFLKGDLLADVDINLGDGREKIVEWLNTIYPNRVSKILNLSTFTTKILLKDVYKTYKDASEEDAQYVTGMVESRFGILQEIDEAYKDNIKFAKWCDSEKEVVLIAKKLSGLIRQTSTHASGYLVSFYELDSIIPLESDKEGNIVSGYDMREVANFAVKLDLLGLSTNLIIKDILEYTKEDITKVNLDNDPFIYDRYQNSDLLPYGLYQISADCAYRVLNEIKPKNIYELSDLNALARPGALAYVDSYRDYTAVCPHKVFEPILSKSRYTCLYQEQMMQMSVAIGFTLEEAEKLRKIVGKKLIHEVAEWKEKIYKKCKDNGFDHEIGDILWKILDDSSKYSFNQCLSPDTVVETKSGPKMLFEVEIGNKIRAFDVNNKKDHYVCVVNKFNNNKEVYEVELDDGRKISCSMDHKFLTEHNGMQRLEDIILHKFKIITD